MIAMASFGSGIITDRFLFSSSQSSPGSGPDKYTPGISSKDDGAGFPRENSAKSDRPDNNNDSSREQIFSGKDHQDPVRQIIMEIESGRGIDSARVSSLLDQLPPGKQRREFIDRISWNWARQNPKAALAWADTLLPSEKLSATGSIVHEWARSDPGGATDYVTQMPKSQRSLDWVHETARIWAQQDQLAALDWAMKQTDPAIRQRALSGSVESWANSDAIAAGNFAVALENPYERHAVLETVARRWARQSVEESLQWALDLKDGNRDRATVAIFAEMAVYDPKQAATMFEEISSSLPSGESRDGIHSNIARELADRWAASNPKEAAAWAIGLPESDSIQRQAVERVADRWASSNPGAAAAWVLELPESDNIQRHAIERVTERWLRSDSMAASEWITEMPEGDARDAAAGELVRYIARSDQFSAFSWATSVSNEGYQTELMRDVLARWQRTDPVAARSAVDTADVTAEQREEFQRVLGASPAIQEQPGDPAAN